MRTRTTNSKTLRTKRHFLVYDTFLDFHDDERVHQSCPHFVQDVLGASSVPVAGAVEVRGVGVLALPFLVVGPLHQELRQTQNKRSKSEVFGWLVKRHSGCSGVGKPLCPTCYIRDPACQLHLPHPIKCITVMAVMPCHCSARDSAFHHRLGYWARAADRPSLSS